MDFDKLKIVKNGELILKSETLIPANGIYEVMRLNASGPLFFEKHIERLNKSLELAGQNKKIDENVIKSYIHDLVRANGSLDANLTVIVSTSAGNCDVFVYYSPVVLTPSGLYKNGCELKRVGFERKNPEEKALTDEMNALRKRLKEDSCYDYLLVDEDGCVREGSKTNIFFFKGSVFYTAHSSKVLSGITRDRVLSILTEAYSLKYEDISSDRIGEFDGAFLTGTSPGILPVRKIDDIEFSASNFKIIMEISSLYRKDINSYYDKLDFFGEVILPMFTREQALLGDRAFRKLSSASVLVVGLGGVGSSALEALVRAGVMHFGILDFDTVEDSNINRQIIALKSEIGRSKTEVCEERIRDINPYARVDVFNFRLETDNLSFLDAYNYDYIVDAIDTFESKLALIKYANSRSIPIISACGAASKLDVSKIKLADVFETAYCPLAKKLRKSMREAGISKLDVVYSDEDSPIIKSADGKLSSISYIPPVFGYMMAAHVIKKLFER